jgi:hypothetical protein
MRASQLFFWSSFCVAACAGTPARVAEPPAWHVVLSNLQATLLCVWGAADNNVFAVGGPLGNGSPSAVMHYDGARWHDLGPGGTETFWWAHGTGPNDVWAVGENGRITHWDGANFTEHVSGTTATLFGVWAAGPNDVWAVGGTPGKGTVAPNDVVLHFDGAGWTPSPVPQALGRTFFKVWGAAADDIYVVGEAGTVWHRSAGQWTLELQSMASMPIGTLLTVNGCTANEVYAVGGSDVLRSDGKTWTRVDVQLDNQASGVACASPGNAVIVCNAGLKERLVGGHWQDARATPGCGVVSCDFSQEPHTDLHGAWADRAGGYWAVGGDYISKPVQGAPRAGLLAYYGTTPPSGATAR